MKEKIPHFVKHIPDLQKLLKNCRSYHFVDSFEKLYESAFGGPDNDYFEVKFDLPGNRTVVDATVARVRNGIVVNYVDPYMRRRDPDCMLIGDDLPSDKPRFEERFGYSFSKLRQETFDWLSQQNLAVMAFKTGWDEIGDDAIAVVPTNCSFFALALAELQGCIPIDELPDDFSPKSIIWVAPSFRFTHFNEKQIVVHNRGGEIYEIFSYNLYPGPSAKKGVYSILIHKGEKEGWVVPHCSAIQAITPYDNVVTFMHEGASGGGKSEMLEQPHRLPDGRLLMGRNIVTEEKVYIEIPRTCDIRAVCDDMAMAHPVIQAKDGKLRIVDAENGWFIRVNHITDYGTDPKLEKLTAQASVPLFFLNIDAVPNSRALIWEHIEDAPNVPCPNPRVIIPRDYYPGSVKGAVAVDYRSFGVRTPPCTREKPTYGIIGLFHILPPALAWLWRLVAPRGHSNPSIVGAKGMQTEGVGSYWPFATGQEIKQANLLLDQFEKTTKTRYILVPNQHIGAFETGFMSQWITRDYLARRGTATFYKDTITESRCPLLGYAIKSMRIEGTRIPHWFLEVDTQPQVGEDGYDKGAEILKAYFEENLRRFQKPELSQKGQQIIECCLDDGKASDYETFFPNYSSFVDSVTTWN